VIIMTTTYNGAFGELYPDPFSAAESAVAANGLPGAAEIAKLAAVYFPEFAPVPSGEPVPEPAHGGLSEADFIRAAREAAGSADTDTARKAYSPAVLPLGADGAALEKPSLEKPLQSSQQAVREASRIYVGPKDLASIRGDFPILSEKVNGHDLIWLDNAATTQRPRQVIERLTYFYEHENSNVHRGAHELAARSTDAYEDARDKVAQFIGAPSAENIVFVRGTTEGINLAAHAYVKQFLRSGDEIILTMLEHHANIVPWQLIAEETGAVLRVAPIDQSGQIILSEYSKLFNPRTRFVSASHVSNALGTIAPVAEMIQIAHAHGVRILIDGAQSVSHIPINVSALDADFFVFSGHKIFAPTGIGVLYGKADVLEAAKPYQGGGNMIADVTFERTLYQKAPLKFEAGTGNIADAVGLGAALDYVSSLGIANIAAWEHQLLQYGIAELGKIPGLRLIGTAREKAGVLSFVLDRRGLEEVGTYLNSQGIAVRAGHHCAQPVLRSFGLEGTIRPSLAFYNTPGEIDALVRALRQLVRS
jgi:cysteine desulfurase/selenocysteine lyase